MSNLINLAFSNFALVMMVLTLACITLQWSRDHKIATVEIFYRWTTLLALGVTELYAFIMHTFFPSVAAAAIGWQASPFQYEVGMANLGFGLIAVLSFSASYSFRVASVIASTCWLWGDAMGHIYQMLTQHNFNPGNAGSWFWFDVIIPLILISCILKLKPTIRGY
jgi:hypothetical protein